MPRLAGEREEVVGLAELMRDETRNSKSETRQAGAGRRCVRCGKKLGGYRGFFCGEECRRADYREKKQARRAKARLGRQCPLCGSWLVSQKQAVS